MKMEPAAFALRPVRFIGKDTIVNYTATTFPQDPYGGCEITMRRCEAFGYLKDPHPDLLIDVLGEDGSIIQGFGISKKGFEYLRRALRFVRDEPQKSKRGGTNG